MNQIKNEIHEIIKQIIGWIMNLLSFVDHSMDYNVLLH